ncbi:hypothetical protein Xmar_13270 [Xanthomonas axonopodis pv. martyniicola]|nr:hypothetical protein Xmar_13270 [Xanthomonas axonopodis pv. martyniicola]
MIGGGMERRYRGADSSDLWWQIALGGFIALLAHSIVIGLYSRYETRQAMAQLERESKLATQQMRRAFTQNAPAPKQAQDVRDYAPPRPLRVMPWLHGRPLRLPDDWLPLQMLPDLKAPDSGAHERLTQTTYAVGAAG